MHIAIIGVGPVEIGHPIAGPRVSYLLDILWQSVLSKINVPSIRLYRPHLDDHCRRNHGIQVAVNLLSVRGFHDVEVLKDEGETSLPIGSSALTAERSCAHRDDVAIFLLPHDDAIVLARQMDPVADPRMSVVQSVEAGEDAEMIYEAV